MIAKQILLVSTLRSAQGTVWRKKRTETTSYPTADCRSLRKKLSQVYHIHEIVIIINTHKLSLQGTVWRKKRTETTSYPTADCRSLRKKLSQVYHIHEIVIIINTHKLSLQGTVWRKKRTETTSYPTADCRSLRKKLSQVYHIHEIVIIINTHKLSLQVHDSLNRHGSNQDHHGCLVLSLVANETKQLKQRKTNSTLYIFSTEHKLL